MKSIKYKKLAQARRSIRVQATEKIRDLRTRYRLKGLDVRQLREEGRA